LAIIGVHPIGHQHFRSILFVSVTVLDQIDFPEGSLADVSDEFEVVELDFVSAQLLVQLGAFAAHWKRP
jgi:hypothetical protein